MPIVAQLIEVLHTPAAWHLIIRLQRIIKRIDDTIKIQEQKIVFLSLLPVPCHFSSEIENGKLFNHERFAFGFL